MAKIKIDLSNALKKVNIDKIAKALGAEKVSKLEEIVDIFDSMQYIKLGDPVVLSLNNLCYPKISKMDPFELGLQYITGRFAANHRIERKDILAYRLLEKEEAKEAKKELGVEGYVIQFYTSKRRAKKVAMAYEESDVRVYIL